METDKVPYRMLKPEPNKTEENKATVETKIVPDEDKPTSMTVENSTKVVLETEDLLQVQPAYGADISEDLQKIEVSKSTITKKTSLFDDNDSDDNELFSNKTSLKKKQDVHIPRFATDNKKTETKKSRLFGSDDDSDGDLFQKSSTKRNSDKMPPSLKTERVKSKDLYKSSLFNDSSSDDDLFSSGAKGLYKLLLNQYFFYKPIIVFQVVQKNPFSIKLRKLKKLIHLNYFDCDMLL